MSDICFRFRFLAATVLVKIMSHERQPSVYHNALFIVLLISVMLFCDYYTTVDNTNCNKAALRKFIYFSVICMAITSALL